MLIRGLLALSVGRAQWTTVPVYSNSKFGTFGVFLKMWAPSCG